MQGRVQLGDGGGKLKIGVGIAVFQQLLILRRPTVVLDGKADRHGKGGGNGADSQNSFLFHDQTAPFRSCFYSVVCLKAIRVIPEDRWGRVEKIFLAILQET